MKFSSWLENRLLTEGRKKGRSKPVQMPKPESNVVKPNKEPKERKPPGMPDTTFRPRPTPRGQANRRAIEEN